MRIQCAYRGRLARKRCKELRSETREPGGDGVCTTELEEGRAVPPDAPCLQQQRHNAALMIQSTVRRFLAQRKSAARAAAEQEKALEDYAAVLIQAVFRKAKARDAVGLRQRAVVTVQTAARGCLARHRVTRQRVAVQSLQLQNAAASTISRCYRGWAARKKRRLLLAERNKKVAAAEAASADQQAALAIQAVYRGHCVRRKQRALAQQQGRQHGTGQEKGKVATGKAGKPKLKMTVPPKVSAHVVNTRARVRLEAAAVRCLEGFFLIITAKRDLCRRRREMSAFRIQTWWRQRHGPSSSALLQRSQNTVSLLASISAALTILASSVRRVTYRTTVWSPAHPYVWMTLPAAEERELKDEEDLMRSTIAVEEGTRRDVITRGLTRSLARLHVVAAASTGDWKKMTSLLSSSGIDLIASPTSTPTAMLETISRAALETTARIQRGKVGLTHRLQQMVHESRTSPLHLRDVQPRRAKLAGKGLRAPAPAAPLRSDKAHPHRKMQSLWARTHRLESEMGRYRLDLEEDWAASSARLSQQLQTLNLLSRPVRRGGSKYLPPCRT
eukprot:Sspe_Gene.39221::Locus_18926_Transcript_1_1_Confidence_1.000_Length_1751::g.39221::m.39221